MEHEHNDKMCEWCGRHKDGRYMWLRLVLAILIGVFIFLAGIQIGELRGEVYSMRGERMMRWHNEDTGGMMMNDMNMSTTPGQDGSTTVNLVSPAHPVNPTTPAQQ